MAPKRKSKRTTSNTSNKKSRVENEEGTLTDQQYKTLYEYYCENWYQKNAESGGGTLRSKRQPPRMKSMQRVFEAMKKAHKKSDKTDAKNILYRYHKWYQSGAKYPSQRPRDWFQKLLAEDDNDDIVFGDEMEIVETISLLDEQDEHNTIDMETWVLECILVDSNLVKPEGGNGGSNDIVVKEEVGGDEEDDCDGGGDADVGKLEVGWKKYFNALKEYKYINGQYKEPPVRYKHVVK